MRGPVDAGGACSFAETGVCARSMEAEDARRRATARRRIFIRVPSRKCWRSGKRCASRTESLQGGARERQDARSSFADLLSRSHSLLRFVFQRLLDVRDYSSDVEESEWIDSQRMFISFPR